jgi:hypothetical protein
MRRIAITVGLGALVLSSCTGADDTADGSTGPATSEAASTATVPLAEFPPAPDAPTGPNDEATAAFDEIVDTIPTGLLTADLLTEFADAADARHAWLISDLLRFAGPSPEATALLDGFESLTGVDARELADDGASPWNAVTNLLIAWDTPAPPEYQRLKGGLFSIVEPGWTPFFDDADATIDWRWVSWGGVFIDDRPLGDTEPCGARGCIPALDDPALVPADQGDFYPDDAIVFGVTEGDEAVAFPKNVMEIHEMVNITIGGRRFGIPYCTLCGSAQAFYTDEVPDGVEMPVLRTSGLLSRSNKVMYDLATSSVFDTFTGEAVAGPLREAGVVLEQNSVAVSRWGDWKAAHPDTTIVAEDGGIGREYEDDPLEGRDDDGPIFPVGDVDPRLGVHEAVIGVVLDDGTTIAFPTERVRSVMLDGDDVELGGVRIERDGGGFGATVDGTEIATHEAFWFAWSQFHPDTKIWTPPS